MAMVLKLENPGALAGAARVDITILVGNSDLADPIAGPLELQVRMLLARYVLPLHVATTLAELAFATGRSR
jgi:hypothetical protein